MVEPMTHPRDPVNSPPPPAATPTGQRLRGAVPASGSSGLSDYAVSPLGVPAALLRGQEEVRVAVLARTSTDDLQDPRQSIMRQVGTCRTALPDHWVIV